MGFCAQLMIMVFVSCTFIGMYFFIRATTLAGYRAPSRAAVSMPSKFSSSSDRIGRVEVPPKPFSGERTHYGTAEGSDSAAGGGASRSNEEL